MFETYEIKHIDLLIRTDGVRRLSNFMLNILTNNKSYILFEDNYWPSICIGKIAIILIFYMIEWKNHTLESIVKIKKLQGYSKNEESEKKSK